MKLHFFYSFLLIPLVIVFIGYKENSFIKTEVHQSNNSSDSIIKVPILEIQDSSFNTLLKKIVKYKDLKKEQNQENVPLYAVIKISYYKSDIYIESIQHVSTVLYKGASILPQGVISICGYDFFFYDPYEITPYFVKKTTLFKEYEYKSKGIFEILDDEAWSFTIKNGRIELDNFYPIKKIDKDLFLEIYYE